MLVDENGNGGLGTVIIYRGALSDNARKRLAACRKDNHPVFAINMDLFTRNRNIIRRDFVSWSINHLIAELSFSNSKGQLFKKPYGRSYWTKAAVRDCKRSLEMAHGLANAI